MRVVGTILALVVAASAKPHILLFVRSLAPVESEASFLPLCVECVQ
jgi:hypothetical protein